jgi:hypothetical protein
MRNDRFENFNRQRDIAPGSLMNANRYFRVSLTASDEMVTRALPAFEEAGRSGLSTY